MFAFFMRRIRSRSEGREVEVDGVLLRNFLIPNKGEVNGQEHGNELEALDPIGLGVRTPLEQSFVEPFSS